MANNRAIKREEIDEMVAHSRSLIADIDLGWLAGIVDGEGTITITPRKRSDAKCQHDGWMVTVRIANTDYRMIEKIKSLTSLICGRSGYIQEKRNNRCKKQYYWLVASRKALIFLRLIEPYLITKREQARLAIELQERITSFTGIQVKGRDKFGRIVKGSAISNEEEEFRRNLYSRIKILNARGPTRQELIEGGI